MGKTKTLMMLALLLLSAAPAAAKDGFYVGAGTLFNNIRGDTTAPESFEAGNGPALFGGLGFYGNFAIEAGVWKSKHPAKPGGSANDLEAGTLDLKILFPIHESHIEPFVLLGAGSYTIEQGRFTEHGKGGRIGVGIDIYLFPDIALSVGFAQSHITFRSNTADPDANITSMQYSISYHFE